MESVEGPFDLKPLDVVISNNDLVSVKSGGSLGAGTANNTANNTATNTVTNTFESVSQKHTKSPK